MEIKGSLPRPQEPATGPNSGPHEYSLLVPNSYLRVSVPCFNRLFNKTPAANTQLSMHATSPARVILLDFFALIINNTWIEPGVAQLV
jgi:hypothetical protein